VKPETKLSRAIREQLTKCGFMVERIQSGKVKVRRGWMYLASKGTPDLHLVGLGWLEVKRPGEEPDDEQLRWHAQARGRGARVAVVHSVAEAVELARVWRKCS
jgi:hypothetical protein